MFKVKEGDWYSEKYVRDGLKKAQEAYGGGGYMEFTGYPDLNPKNDGLAPVRTDGNAAAPAATPPPASDENANAKNENGSNALKPTVDVTMRLSEGKQFFVNRITFIGNTTTRDNVIRREMRLVEGSIFNTESLKYSIRRLNQLGYFKNLEGNDKDMKVDKTAGTRQPGRRHAEGRGAEPQPAHLRRGRLAVPRASSASSRSRPPTSSAAARA